MRAKVYCEVTCGNCGVTTSSSDYYKNSALISKLKEETRDWIWDEKQCMNLCPSCQEELKKGVQEEEQRANIFDMWDAINGR